VGRVLIMALLMLQLSVRRHVTPWKHIATLPDPARFDPMTFGVNGLRQLILGGIDGVVAGHHRAVRHMGCRTGDLVLSADESALEPQSADTGDQDLTVRFRVRLISGTSSMAPRMMMGRPAAAHLHRRRAVFVRW